VLAPQPLPNPSPTPPPPLPHPANSGPFRFLRMRRVLQALDDVRSDSAAAKASAGVALGVSANGSPLGSRSNNITRLCGAALSTKAVGFVLLAARIILFVLCSASIILMFEFPCEMWVLPRNLLYAATSASCSESRSVCSSWDSYCRLYPAHPQCVKCVVCAGWFLTRRVSVCVPTRVAPSLCCRPRSWGCSVLENNAIAPPCHPEFKEFHQAGGSLPCLSWHSSLPPSPSLSKAKQICIWLSRLCCSWTWCCGSCAGRCFTS
jgi:hypothetical protein